MALLFFIVCFLFSHFLCLVFDCSLCSHQRPWRDCWLLPRLALPFRPRHLAAGTCGVLFWVLRWFFSFPVSVLSLFRCRFVVANACVSNRRASSLRKRSDATTRYETACPPYVRCLVPFLHSFVSFCVSLFCSSLHHSTQHNTHTHRTSTTARSLMWWAWCARAVCRGSMTAPLARYLTLFVFDCIVLLLF